MRRKNKEIIVVSMFDGMSGAQQALDRVKGLKAVKYYSSEIDKYAIQVTQKNYPNTIQLGSIVDLNKKQLRKLKKSWGNTKVLLVGGSPCQGFSVSGKLKGSSTECGIDVVSLKQYKKLKKDGFSFNGQSYLFWEYMRVMKILKPDWFLLENVRVTKKWLPMFNDSVGVDPIFINSELVSAQSRPRYYWTNIKNIKQPKDKVIMLGDILEDLPTDKKLEQFMVGEFNGVGGLDKGIFNFIGYDKGECQTTGSTHANKFLIRRCTLKQNITTNHVANADDINGHDILKRIHGKDGKSPTMTTCSGGNNEPKVLIGGVDVSEGLYRKLTLTECERLQTVSDDYTSGVSDTQRKKMIGNGFTIDVIVHFMKGLRDE